MEARSLYRKLSPQINRFWPFVSADSSSSFFILEQKDAWCLRPCNTLHFHAKNKGERGIA
jgi:hypothetical protein